MPIAPIWKDYLIKRGADTSKLKLVDLENGLSAKEEQELGIAGKNQSEAALLRKGWQLDGTSTQAITIDALQKREADIKTYADYLKKISPKKLTDDAAMLQARELYASGTNFEARELNADVAIKAQAEAITSEGEVKLTEETGPLWGQVKAYVDAHKNIEPVQVAKYVLWVTEALKYEPAVQTRFFKLEPLTAPPSAPPAVETPTATKKGPVKARKGGKAQKAAKQAKPAASPPTPAPVAAPAAKPAAKPAGSIDGLFADLRAKIKAENWAEAKKLTNRLAEKAEELNEAQSAELTKITDELVRK